MNTFCRQYRHHHVLASLLMKNVKLSTFLLKFLVYFPWRLCVIMLPPLGGLPGRVRVQECAALAD